MEPPPDLARSFENFQMKRPAVNACQVGCLREPLHVDLLSVAFS